MDVGLGLRDIRVLGFRKALSMSETLGAVAMPLLV